MSGWLGFSFSFCKKQGERRGRKKREHSVWRKDLPVPLIICIWCGASILPMTMPFSKLEIKFPPTCIPRTTLPSATLCTTSSLRFSKSLPAFTAAQTAHLTPAATLALLPVRPRAPAGRSLRVKTLNTRGYARLPDWIRKKVVSA